MLIRSIIYTVIIFMIELSFGMILEQIIGQCPWKYSTGQHVLGYIRLDYMPAWMCFSIVVESLYNYMRDQIEGKRETDTKGRL